MVNVPKQVRVATDIYHCQPQYQQHWYIFLHNCRATQDPSILLVGPFCPDLACLCKSIRTLEYRSKCLIPNASKFGGPKWGVFRDSYHIFSRRACFQGILVPNLKKKPWFFHLCICGYMFHHHTMLLRWSTSSRSPTNNKKVDISTCKFILIFSLVYCPQLLHWAHLHLQYFVFGMMQQP